MENMFKMFADGYRMTKKLPKERKAECWLIYYTLLFGFVTWILTTLYIIYDYFY